MKGAGQWTINKLIMRRMRYINSLKIQRDIKKSSLTPNSIKIWVVEVGGRELDKSSR